MSLIDELGLDLDGTNPDDVERQLNTEPPPPGKYHAVLTATKAVVANSGSEGQEFTYVILTPEHEGYEFRDTLYFTEKTKSRQMMYMARLGIIKSKGEGKQKKFVKGDVEDFEGAIGTEFIVEIDLEKFTKKNGGEGIACKMTYGGLFALDDERVKGVPRVKTATAKSAVETAKANADAGEDDYSDI